MVKRNLERPVLAMFIRFLPKEWKSWPCMRVEVYGKPASKSTYTSPQSVEFFNSKAILYDWLISSKMKLEKQQWKGTMSAEYQWHGFVNIAFKLVVLTYLGHRRHILQQLNQRPGKRIVPLMFFSPHPYPNLGKKPSRLNSNSVREVVLFYL